MVHDEEAGTRYVVELGDTIVDLPADPHVAGLCLRMYASVCTITPRCIYLYASGDDFTSDAHGAEMIEDSITWPTLHGCGGNETDCRYNVTRMSHVPVTLVQEFAHTHESASFGTTRSSFTFESMDRALLALAVNKVHNRGTAKDVLSILCRSLDSPCLNNVFGKKLTPIIGESSHLDDNKVVIGTSTWINFLKRTRSRRFMGKMEYLWVLCLGSCTNCGIKIVFVDHHWTESFDRSNRPCLSHRVVPECNLIFYSQALSGGVVLFDYKDFDNSFHWWISDEMKRIPSELYLGITTTKIRMREEGFTLEQPIVDKRTKTVIEKWEKSSNSRGVYAPLLLKMVRFDLDGDEVLQSRSGNLQAFRRYRVDDMNDKDDVGDIFRAEFGKDYGNQVLERVETFPEMACYLVHDENIGLAIGAFCVLLFDCVLDDGTLTLALMIDSFAVKRKFHGNGYGRYIFHDMVHAFIHRRLLKEETGRRYVIFAQCVLSSPGRDYWYDKLDESGDARCLLLQAFTKYPEYVSIQSTNCCTPRSRIYRLDNVL
jgi:GNAT superfamily N-acetyltransferase